MDIRKFLPDIAQGSIIITTRSPQVRLGLCIPVQKLTDARESVEILASMSRRALSVNDPIVLALVRKLDGFPLALATAGAYLDQVNISITEYLELYETSWLELHESDPGLDSYQDKTLYSAWRISLNQIQRQNELAMRLLGLWCYFSNEDLWYELLCAGSSAAIPWIRELTTNLRVFTEAVRLLCNYGLVEVEKVSEEAVESGGYSIHSCVHAWSIYVLNAQWDYTLARFAVDATGQHVPDENDVKPWITQRRLLQHADRCSRYVKEGLVEDAGIELSMHRLGLLYARQGKLAEAEAMYDQALRGKQMVFGAEHTLTLDTVNNLGVLYARQGKLAEAEAMYNWALQGYEKLWGLEHTSTLNVFNNLGVLYARQGKLEEAEPMHDRALQGYEKAFGPEHTSTLDTVNNLGVLYAEQGKLEEAEVMFDRALRGKEKMLGADHMSTLDTVNNLGSLYVDQRRLAEAEAMYNRALRGKGKGLGAGHLSTLDTVKNLSILHAEQGRLAEAEAMYDWALQGYEKAPGYDHTETVPSANSSSILGAGQIAPKAVHNTHGLIGQFKASRTHKSQQVLGQFNDKEILAIIEKARDNNI